MLPIATAPKIAQEVAKNLDFKVRNLSGHVGFAIGVLTALFSLACIFYSFNSFPRLSPQKQRAFLAFWKKIPLNLTKDLVKFYERLTVFIYFSLLEERNDCKAV